MKKLKKIILLFISLLLLSSCFEIIEEITLHKNGSGDIAITLNLSQSKSKIASIMLMDSINGFQIPSRSEITNFVKKTTVTIKNTSGISNVKSSLDLDNFILNFSCNFENIHALNQVIAAFGNHKERSKINKQQHFIYNTNTQHFSRSYHYDLSKEFDKVKAIDKNALKEASYTTIYRFDQPIISTSNRLSKLAPNKKAVLIKVSGAAMLTGEHSIKNNIQLLKEK
ncbi:MAG: hypothetical protein COB98_10455 [Flavobacteriaceae bacterium]|nr:MAG: hypothetical protein COB98_10455 [Flavobacteriaceae bacterium]